MPDHIKPFDNRNHPIVDRDHHLVPRTYMNRVRLKKGESFTHKVEGYESVCVLAWGTCDIVVDEKQTFEKVGKRQHLFEGKPDSVYVPLDSEARITCLTDEAEIFIAGGKTDKRLEPFRVTPDESEKVQYGSDETKTHRKIYHVLGQNAAGRTDKLLVSELFTVGAGGWSGFPPHKHDEDREGESAFEEVYYFKFNPDHGFGAQFAYVHEDDYGPVYHIKDGSTIILERGYHPVVAAPGYEMYYFTILVGKTTRSLVQHFEPRHAYQVKTIPGLSDMIDKFK